MWEGLTNYLRWKKFDMFIGLFLPRYKSRISDWMWSWLGVTIHLDEAIDGVVWRAASADTDHRPGGPFLNKAPFCLISRRRPLTINTTHVISLEYICVSSDPRRFSCNKLKFYYENGTNFLNFFMFPI